MRILRRAGYRRRTPHKKSACAERHAGPEHNRAHGPSRRRSPIDTDVRWIHGAPSPRLDRPAPPGAPPRHRHRPASGRARTSPSRRRSSCCSSASAAPCCSTPGAVDGDGRCATTVDAARRRLAVDANHARRIRPRRRPHPRPRGPRRRRRGLHRPSAHDRRRPRRRRRARLLRDLRLAHRGRHARSRGPPPRGLRHPRPPRGLDRGPRPDDRAAPHGRHGLSRSHLRRGPHRPARHPRPARHLRRGARRHSTCSAATSR